MQDRYYWHICLDWSICLVKKRQKKQVWTDTSVRWPIIRAFSRKLTTVGSGWWLRSWTKLFLTVKIVCQHFFFKMISAKKSVLTRENNNNTPPPHTHTEQSVSATNNRLSPHLKSPKPPYLPIPMLTLSFSRSSSTRPHVWMYWVAAVWLADYWVVLTRNLLNMLPWWSLGLV